MDEDSKVQRKMEDSGGGLLPAVEGHSLEQNIQQRRIEPTTLHQAGQRAQQTTNELFRPPAPMVHCQLNSENYRESAFVGRHTGNSTTSTVSFDRSRAPTHLLFAGVAAIAFVPGAIVGRAPIGLVSVFTA